MTRAEAIEKLKRWKLEVNDEKDYAEYLEGWFYKDDEIAFDMAIEALKFQEVYDVTIKAVNKHCDEHHTVIMDWIPCSERLLDDGEEYLVTVQCDGHSIVDIDQCFSYGWDDYGADVIAWMPLPTPYQEDNQ